MSFEPASAHIAATFAVPAVFTAVQAALSDSAASTAVWAAQCITASGRSSPSTLFTASASVTSIW